MMDISKITDLDKLKAIAYDLLRERERLQADLDKVILQIQRAEHVQATKDKQESR